MPEEGGNHRERDEQAVQRVFEICGLLDHFSFRDDENDVVPDTSGATPRTGVAPDRLVAHAPGERRIIRRMGVMRRILTGHLLIRADCVYV